MIMLVLKDGGKYVNRLGDVVIVHDNEWSTDYPFYHEDGNGSVATYKFDGSYFDAGDPVVQDLVVEYKEPEDFVSKAALAKYIRNRLIALEVRYGVDDRNKASESLFAMDKLVELCDEFGIVL